MEVKESTLWRLEFVRPYQTYKRGQVVNLPQGIARSLTLSGIAKVVPDDPQFEFAVTQEPVAEVAIAPAAKAARRRKK